MRDRLILATRGSKLAMVQAHLVQEALEKHWPGLQVELLQIKTSGDAILDRPLRSVGGKGLFVKEIEEALLSRKADLAVHSMKDVPGELPEGLKIGVILKREDPSDVLISRERKLLSQLSPGAKVGTTSLRRKLQLERLRADLQVNDLRGNVETRLKKMNEGQIDAVILAAAGLKRLNLFHEATETLPFICAPGQGAIGIEIRREDPDLGKLIHFLNDESTAACVSAERVILRRLEGGCELPLGAEASLSQGKLHLKAFVASPDGSQWLEDEVSGDLSLAEELGEKLSDLLLGRGAKKILQEIQKIKEK